MYDEILFAGFKMRKRRFHNVQEHLLYGGHKRFMFMFLLHLLSVIVTVVYYSYILAFDRGVHISVSY